MSGEIEIACAREDQLDAILAIENASFTCPWSEESFHEAFASGNITIFSAQRDGALVGFACLLAIGEEAEILNIATAPASRHIGVGQRLLSEMLNDASGRGVSDLYLEMRASNTPARPLYRKNRFYEIGIRRSYYIKPREDAILMKKSLIPAEQGHL